MHLFASRCSDDLNLMIPACNRSALSENPFSALRSKPSWLLRIPQPLLDRLTIPRWRPDADQGVRWRHFAIRFCICLSHWIDSTVRALTASSMSIPFSISLSGFCKLPTRQYTRGTMVFSNESFLKFQRQGFEEV